MLSHKQCLRHKTTNKILPSPFRMAGESVTQNGDPVHVATAIKVDLQLISSRPIIHLFPFQTEHAVFTKNNLSIQLFQFQGWPLCQS